MRSFAVAVLAFAFCSVFYSAALAAAPAGYAKSRMCRMAGTLADRLKDSKTLINAAKDGEYAFLDKPVHQLTKKEYEAARLASFERARNVAFEFPVGKDLGFNTSDVTKRTPFKCDRIKKSCLYNEVCGWSIAGPNGKMVIRLDCPHLPEDRQTGKARVDVKGELMPEPSHFNIEFHIDKPVVKYNLKTGDELNYKLMFDCNGRACTDADIRKLVEQVRH